MESRNAGHKDNVQSRIVFKDPFRSLILMRQEFCEISGRVGLNSCSLPTSLIGALESVTGPTIPIGISLHLTSTVFSAVTTVYLFRSLTMLKNGKFDAIQDQRPETLGASNL